MANSHDTKAQTIEQLMALADAYANARAWCHLDVTEERRQALRAAIEAALKMEHLNYLGCMEDLKEAEKALKPGEPVATVTLNESMGAEFKFNRPHTLLPGQVLYVYAAPLPQVACPSCGSTQVECAVCAAGYTAPQPQREQEPVIGTKAWFDPSTGAVITQDLYPSDVYAAPQPQPDEHVDCPRCGHCCPDDTALHRQALYLIDAWERGCDHADYWREIAALRERLDGKR